MRSCPTPQALFGAPPAVSAAEPVAIGSTGIGDPNGVVATGGIPLLNIVLPVNPVGGPAIFASITSSGFQPGDSEQFTQINGMLRYTGATARIFQVEAQLSFTVIEDSETVPEPIIVAIFKNNAISHSYAFAVEGGVTNSVTITDTVLLQPNDMLSLRVSNVESGATAVFAVGVLSAQISAQA